MSDIARGTVALWQQILEKMAALVSLYPDHIAREDKVFFRRDDGLDRWSRTRCCRICGSLSRRMIHEKYRSVVERLEKPNERSRGTTL